MIGIYKITNMINNKVYIGQAQDIKRRWKEHRFSSKQGSTVLYLAMRKYGIENFSFEIIEECSMEEMSEKEIFYIKQYNSYVHAENSNGYNMTLGGEGNRGFLVSMKTRKKISESKKGIFPTEETRRKLSELRRGEGNSMFNKQHSLETKKKISENKKGCNKGEKSFNSKKVVCEGIEFNCARECAEYYSVKYSTMYSWLNNQRKIPKEWNDRGLSYVESLDKEKEVCKGRKGRNNPNSKRVVCEDIEFDCVKDCAEYYGINYGTMYSWLQGKCRTRKDFIDKGLKYL